MCFWLRKTPKINFLAKNTGRQAGGKYEAGGRADMQAGRWAGGRAIALQSQFSRMTTRWELGNVRSYQSCHKQKHKVDLVLNVEMRCAWSNEADDEAMEAKIGCVVSDTLIEHAINLMI